MTLPFDPSTIAPWSLQAGNVKIEVNSAEDQKLFQQAMKDDPDLRTALMEAMRSGMQPAEAIAALVSQVKGAVDDAAAAEGDAAAAAGDDAAAAADGQDAAADDGARRRRHLGKNKFYNIVTDCTVCVDECDKFENMEANGYIDATNFLECTLIYDPEDDNKAPLYAGPICASSGTKIKIGVFTDEYCQILDETKEVDEYVIANGVSMNLDNLILKSTYTDTCISCQEPVEQNENAKCDATEDVDVVIEMCEQLYNQAVKCETAHGFVDGIANYYGYENQLAQEDIVCDYIASSLTTAGTSNETTIIDINLSPSTPTLVPTSTAPSSKTSSRK